VSNLKTVTTPDGFQLDFDVACREQEIDFTWHGTVTGQASGTLSFDFQGKAQTNFERNRIGFCVLHPLAECAGKSCRAEAPDGTVTNGTFPELIAPHQPLLNLRAVSHQLPDGTEVEVRFAGDIFEMEDHRNWTDGNYKTYCTPLALPFPVKISRGQKVQQSVTVNLKPAAPRAKPAQAIRSHGPGVVELTEGSATGKLPAVGFGIATRAQPLLPRHASLLSVVKPAHLRIDLVFGALAEWRGQLARAGRESAAVGAKLEIALMLGADAPAELRDVAKEAANLRPAITRWLIFSTNHASTPPDIIALARRTLPGTIVSGTNQYFTELNRERPALTSLDGVSYSLNPQVHAFDNASLVENLAPQAVQVKSARQFCGDKAIIVTPVTLRPRFNPQQRGPEPPPIPGRLETRHDHRQPTLFGAAWTLGSLKYLSEAGVDSVTYYETVGWGGLMAESSPQPALPPIKPDMVFPLYHVFADYAEFAGGSWQALETDSPLEAIGLSLIQGPRRRTIVANLTAKPRIIRTPARPQMTIRTLDDRTFALATADPAQFRQSYRTVTTRDKSIDLPLGPYAIVTVDG
jgi:hypothetical protein